MGEETLRGGMLGGCRRGFWRVEMDLKLGNCGGLSWGDDYSRKSSLLRDGRAYVRMMCLQMGNDIDCRESAGSSHDLDGCQRLIRPISFVTAGDEGVPGG